jgi:5'-nucleotidase
VRILVTNDDGINAPGLHALATAMCQLDAPEHEQHHVVVAAPDTEYSGSGAALGALQEIKPTIRRAEIPVPADAAWSVSGAPALCVMFARLGAFGPPFDLVIAGINPGANVGRAVYHSGTVGAALTARNGKISGVAFSQAVTGYGVEGQAWDDAVDDVSWDAAATIARTYVQGMVDDMPTEPVVVNINVPDLTLDEILGWRHTVVGSVPPRTVNEAKLVPVDGDHDAFRVEMDWGDKVNVLPPDTDGGAVEAGYVSVSNLTRMVHENRPDMAPAEAALDGLIRRA